MDTKLAHLVQVDHRRHWKDLKTKHAVAIKAAGLNFEQKLGPSLDKYETQIEALKRSANKGELTNAQIGPIKLLAAPLGRIAEGYVEQVKKLPDPAKKELLGLLTAIEADCKGWEHLVLPAAAAEMTEAQKEATKIITHQLAKLGDTWANNILKRLPSTLGYYEANTVKYPHAPAIINDLLQKGRATAPQARELSKMGALAEQGQNYPLFKSRAKAMLVGLKAYHDAAKEYHDAYAKSAQNGGIKTDKFIDSHALFGYCGDTIDYCNDIIEAINKLT